MSNLQDEVEHAINRCSAENGSNTPDFILAKYLMRCLEAFNETVNAREEYYGRPSRGENASPPLTVNLLPIPCPRETP